MLRLKKYPVTFSLPTLFQLWSVTSRVLVRRTDTRDWGTGWATGPGSASIVMNLNFHTTGSGPPVVLTSTGTGPSDIPFQYWSLSKRVLEVRRPFPYPRPNPATFFLINLNLVTVSRHPGKEDFVVSLTSFLQFPFCHRGPRSHCPVGPVVLLYSPYTQCHCFSPTS